MSYVDDFIKAENELRARQEAAVQRQREWDGVEWTGKRLLKFFGICFLVGAFLGLLVWWRVQ